MSLGYTNRILQQAPSNFLCVIQSFILIDFVVYMSFTVNSNGNEVTKGHHANKLKKNQIIRYLWFSKIIIGLLLKESADWQLDCIDEGHELETGSEILKQRHTESKLEPVLEMGFLFQELAELGITTLFAFYSLHLVHCLVHRFHCASGWVYHERDIQSTDLHFFSSFRKNWLNTL